MRHVAWLVSWMIGLALTGCANPEAARSRGSLKDAMTLSVGASIASNADDSSWIWHEFRIARDATEQPVGVLFLRRSHDHVSVAPTTRAEIKNQAQVFLNLDQFRSLAAFARNGEARASESLESDLTAWYSHDLTVVLRDAPDGAFFCPLFGREYFPRYLSRQDFLAMVTAVERALEDPAPAP